MVGQLAPKNIEDYYHDDGGTMCEVLKCLSFSIQEKLKKSQ